jgi:hypothetical protein
MIWVYKCNSKNHPYQVAYGDWNELFRRNATIEWGSTESVSALSQASAGDAVLAYQTDRNELVGVAEVQQLKRHGSKQLLMLKPVKKIGVKVRPLKESDKRIARIPALQPGPIRTLYPIDHADAERLLRAAGAPMQLVERTSRSKAIRTNNGGGFGSIEQNRCTERAAMRHVTTYLRRHGWGVSDVSLKNLGYDLLAQKRRAVLHVEVKGVGGSERKFIITRGEKRQWSHDSTFVLALVRNARARTPTLDFYRGRNGIRGFHFDPLSFMAFR